MARLYTPYRSLLSEADMEDTGGLLATPRSAPTPATTASTSASTVPTPEQWQRIVNGDTMILGGVYYYPEQTGATGSAEQGTLIPGDLTGRVFRYTQTGGGAPYEILDTSQNVIGTGVSKGSKGFFGDLFSMVGQAVKETAPIWGAALGVNYLLPALAGGEAALGSAGIGGAESAAFADMAAGLTPEFGTTAAYNAAITPAAAAAPMGGVIAPEVMVAAAPELAAVAPEIAGPGLQTITTIGSKAAAASTPWWAPAAVTAAAVPVLSGMTSTAADPYANETAKLERQQPGDLGNMGGPGTPEIPTITTTGPLDGLKAWATANPEIAKLLFSGAGALLNTAGGGGGSGGGGYVDSGYRPTINRGGFNAAPQARQMAPQPTGLLTTPTTGQPMSGLWRYGLLGG